MPEGIREQVLLKLFQECEIANYNPQERMEYEKSLKAQRDLFAIINTAEEKAKQEGKIEGKIEGKVEKTIEVARKAIEKGFDNNTIQELTGLSMQEIERLRQKR